MTTFENEWDYLPAGRQKGNHGVGSVCKFRLNITQSPYTGLLKNGITTGLIRVSLVLRSGGTAMDDNYMPSAGLTFFRSGVSSANFVALTTTSGAKPMSEKANNIFDSNRYTLDTVIHDKEIIFQTGGQMVNKFSQGDPCVAMVGLSDISRYLNGFDKSLYDIF